MELNPENLQTPALYKLLTGTVLPRPIGWISTVDGDGQPNLAPYSFFNVVCANPPHVLFCPGIRAVNQSPKDTMSNVRATGEFVVNIVTEDVAEAMNITATELPPEVNEFERAGLTQADSVVVRPPRVAESPVHFECRLVHCYEVGQVPGTGSVVIGQVVHIQVDETIINDNYHIDLAQLKPIGRLMGSSYCRVTDLFELHRLPSEL